MFGQNIVTKNDDEPGRVGHVWDILRIWPEIDVLVNNAGTARFTPFTATTETDAEPTFEALTSAHQALP